MSRDPDGRELIGLGGVLAGAVIVPMLIGIGIDYLAHSGPIFFLIGLGVGVLGAIVTGYTRFKRYL